MELKEEGRFPGLQKFFRRSMMAASIVMRRRLRVLMLVRNAYRRLGKQDESAVGQLRGDLTALLHLAKAWATGRYRQVPWKSVLFAVAGILYFLNPVDLIPDALVGIGFLDDAAVIAAVVRAINKDLRRFESWEAAQEELSEEKAPVGDLSEPVERSTG